MQNAEKMSGSYDDEQTRVPLLQNAVDGYVDYKGRPSIRSSSGGWRSAKFIIGVEVVERFAYYGIASNLIMYLTGPLGQPTAAAAANVNVWAGTVSLTPLLGAFVADSFLGRYRTVIYSSALYILALGLLTVTAMIPSNCVSNSQNANSASCYSEFNILLFFTMLYLIAISQGGHKPCVQAFGADQFDDNNAEESRAKSSFFNWWFFSLSIGISLTLWILNYIQDNLNWAVGFGIPCLAMVIALVLFWFGTGTYRFSTKDEERSPFVRIGRVFVAAVKNVRFSSEDLSFERVSDGIHGREVSQEFRFLNKALIPNKKFGTLCTVAEIEEAKSVLRLVPIWTTCVVYALVHSQSQTFFTKQGATLDRLITADFKIPAAALQSAVSLTSVVFIPFYERFIVPVARKFTGKPSGITMLQRIGTGLTLGCVAMVTAAIIESKRLRTARAAGLVDSPDATLPMSIWWLLPQYVLYGLSDSFAMVGLQEFFYGQVPDQLRSIGLALFQSIYGTGSLLSSVLVSVIGNVTAGHGWEMWFDNDLNRAHLDYFYWLLVCIGFAGLGSFLFFARTYVYR